MKHYWIYLIYSKFHVCHAIIRIAENVFSNLIPEELWLTWLAMRKKDSAHIYAWTTLDRKI